MTTCSIILMYVTAPPQSLVVQRHNTHTNDIKRTTSNEPSTTPTTRNMRLNSTLTTYIDSTFDFI
eukprot:m.9605 g.9605  ORF g.9605 m.9605 type:complete len:65 (+) comp5472_c0_seq1:60-254(+)